MEINNFVKLNSNNVLLDPYRNGVCNIQKCFSLDARKLIFLPGEQTPQVRSLSLVDRAAHFATGLILLLPAFNIIVYVALKYFATQRRAQAQSPALRTPPNLPQLPVPRLTLLNPSQSPAPRLTPSTPPAPRSLPNPPQPELPPALPHRAPSSGAHIRTGHIGAGVLPYCIYGSDIHFLLSKEGYGEAANTWCEFGGGKETRQETAAETATRECWEESRGILGTQRAIARSVYSSPAIGGKYNIFLVRVESPEKITNEGFTKQVFSDPSRMEKTKIAWVRANDVFQAASGIRPLIINYSPERLRPFFAGLLRDALASDRQRAVIDQIFRSAGAQRSAA